MLIGRGLGWGGGRMGEHEFGDGEREIEKKKNVQARSGACFRTLRTSSGTASQLSSQRASSSCWM